MNWYIAKIVFQIISDKGNHTPQFDEQLRLIEASTHMEAWSKGMALGRKEECTFHNTKKKVVRWKFINISELSPIPQLSDGAELYSLTEEPEDASSYISIVQAKAKEAIAPLSFDKLSHYAY